MKKKKNEKKFVQFLFSAIAAIESSPSLSYEILEKTHNIVIDSEELYYHRGYLYYRLEHYQKAVNDFDKAIEINPNYRDAMYQKACCNRVLKNYKESLNGFDLVLKLEPENYVNYWSRGRVKVDMAKYSEALVDYNKALNLIDKPNVNLYRDRAVVLDTLGLHKEALADYRKCIKNNNNDYVAHSNIGVLYSKLGELDKSKYHLNKAIKIEPTFYQAYLNRGIVYYQQGDYALALNDFNHCEKINSKDTIIYTNRANAYIAINDYEAAQKDLDLAEKYDENCSLIYYLKSKIAENETNKTENYRKYVDLLIKHCNNNINTNQRFYLYRPINKNTLSLLREGYLWFSHPDSFNDPLESNYCNMQAEEDYMQSVLKNIRIRSFTNAKEACNQLLWAHYADKYKGIMIEYEVDINRLNNKNIYAAKVEYKSKLRPQSTDFDMIDLGQSYFVKYKDWKYENEWRLITLNNNLVNGNKLYDGFKIISITFGLKTEEKDIKTIISILPDCKYYNLKRSNNCINGYCKIKRVEYDIESL